MSTAQRAAQGRSATCCAGVQYAARYVTDVGMAHIVMAYLVMAHIVMAYVVMACIGMAYVVMARVVMACAVVVCMVMICIVMVCIVMAYIVMACIVVAYMVMACIVMGDITPKAFESQDGILALHPGRSKIGPKSLCNGRGQAIPSRTNASV